MREGPPAELGARRWACVSPAAALWLWNRFGDQMLESAQRFAEHRDPRIAAELVAALRQLELAAADWSPTMLQADAPGPTSAGTTANGSAEVVSGGERPESQAWSRLPQPRLTCTEAAARMGTSSRWVRALCATGLLPAERAGRAWLIAPEDLDEYQEGRPTASPTEHQEA